MKEKIESLIELLEDANEYENCISLEKALLILKDMLKLEKNEREN